MSGENYALMDKHLTDELLGDFGYDLVNYEDEILEIKNPYLSFGVLKYGYSKIKREKEHINVIIESRNPELIYGLLSLVPEKINIQTCLDIIAESGDSKYNYWAVKLYGFKQTYEESIYDYSKNVQSILYSKDPEYNYELAMLVKNHLDYIAKFSELEKQYYSISSDDESSILDKCKENIVNSESAKFNYLYAKNISNDDPIHSTIVKNSKSGKFNYLFGRDVAEKDKEEYYQIVLDNKDIPYVYEIALDYSKMSDYDKNNNVNGTKSTFNIDDYFNCIIESGCAEYNYLAAFNIKDSNKRKHLDVVIKSLDPEFCYLSALAIDFFNDYQYDTSVYRGTNFKFIRSYLQKIHNPLNKNDLLDEKERLGIAVMFSGNLEYNYLFARDVKGADVTMHEKVILAALAADYSRKFIEIPGSDYDAHCKVIFMENRDKIKDITGYTPPRPKVLEKKLDLMVERKKMESRI